MVVPNCLPREHNVTKTKAQKGGEKMDKELIKKALVFLELFIRLISELI